MIYKGQLRYTDSAKTKVQFHYTKGVFNAQSKALEVEKLPSELRDKLAANPKGVGHEMAVDDNGRIDLAASAAAQVAARREPFQGGGGRSGQRPAQQPGQQRTVPQAARGNPNQGGGGGVRQRPAQQPGLQRTISTVEGERVLFAGGGDISRKNINVTDPSLGLQPGNVVGQGNSLVRLERFGSSVDGVNDQKPDIDRNPYNFVEFAADAPWTEQNPDLTHAHPMEGRLSGVLQYEMKTKTPLFVPAGFPFGRNKEEADAVRRQPRHFMRMTDATKELHYAIPGSSMKGVVRAEVEALSNSRLGVLLDADFFAMPIPYRRRSFEAGVVLGRHPTKAGWEVQPVRVLYMLKGDWKPFPAPGTPVGYDATRDGHKDYALPNPTGTRGHVRKYLAGLAVAETNKPYGGLIVDTPRPPIFLSDSCVEEYVENLKHPHYENHPNNAKTGFYSNIKASILKEPLKADDLIYYTEEAGKITTFGKNINYLWPSSRSVTDLCGKFQVPKSKDRKHEILGLSDPLSMAERLFGFSGAHIKDKDKDSHPFRGLLRFETAWGPKAATYEEEKLWPALTRETPATAQAAAGWKIELAPLTGPETRAKSRPLYLQPGADGNSASWEDNPAPKLRGRKFYWPQSACHSAGKIWKFHLKDAAHVASQLPPPVYALKEETSFKGKVHFRNLAPEELGALIFALEGADDGKGYNHTLRIGKGKPRGLGNVECKVVKIDLDADPRLLLDGKWASADGDGKAHVEKFQAWVKEKAGSEFWEAEYIKSYRHLHHWQEGSQVRYYPINFADYGWLPHDAKGNTKGDPKGDRPEAMNRAPFCR